MQQRSQPEPSGHNARSPCLPAPLPAVGLVSKLCGRAGETEIFPLDPRGSARLSDLQELEMTHYLFKNYHFLGWALWCSK